MIQGQRQCLSVAWPPSLTEGGPHEAGWRNAVLCSLDPWNYLHCWGQEIRGVFWHQQSVRLSWADLHQQFHKEFTWVVNVSSSCEANNVLCYRPITTWSADCCLIGHGNNWIGQYELLDQQQSADQVVWSAGQVVISRSSSDRLMTDNQGFWSVIGLANQATSSSLPILYFIPQLSRALFHK